MSTTLQLHSLGLSCPLVDSYFFLSPQLGPCPLCYSILTFLAPGQTVHSGIFLHSFTNKEKSPRKGAQPKAQNTCASHSHTSIPLTGPYVVPSLTVHRRKYSSFFLPSFSLVVKSLLISNSFTMAWTPLVDAWDRPLNSQKPRRLSPPRNRPVSWVFFTRHWEVLYDNQYANQY